jgi:hypothetical protein
MQKIFTALRYLWALPTTAVGLCLGVPALASGGSLRVVKGVLEFEGGFVTFFLTHGTLLRGGANAMTLGHVVLGRNRAALAMTRRHERVHVRQCERWGPLFLPAYGIASVIAWWRGLDPYFDNPFECEAYTIAG